MKTLHFHSNGTLRNGFSRCKDKLKFFNKGKSRYKRRASGVYKAVPELHLINSAYLMYFSSLPYTHPCK